MFVAPFLFLLLFKGFSRTGHAQFIKDFEYQGTNRRVYVRTAKIISRLKEKECSADSLGLVTSCVSLSPVTVLTLSVLDI